MGRLVAFKILQKSHVFFSQSQIEYHVSTIFRYTYPLTKGIGIFCWETTWIRRISEKLFERPGVH